MATDPEMAIVPLSDDATLLRGTPNRTEQTQVSPSSIYTLPHWMLHDMADMGSPVQLGKGKGKGWYGCYKDESLNGMISKIAKSTHKGWFIVD